MFWCADKGSGVAGRARALCSGHGLSKPSRAPGQVLANLTVTSVQKHRPRSYRKNTQTVLTPTMWSLEKCAAQLPLKPTRQNLELKVSRGNPLQIDELIRDVLMTTTLSTVLATTRTTARLAAAATTAAAAAAAATRTTTPTRAAAAAASHVAAARATNFFSTKWYKY